MKNALAGIRVLDFSRVFAGPLCTQLLADLGAEVLKIERPGTGDETRAWGPPFEGGESAYYLCLNRGKRSLELDLNTEAGQAEARRLATAADVAVENFAAGWMERRGLGWEALAELNPRLVHLSLTGYGETGPDAELPGYDILVQGRGGLMSITGEPGGQPMKVGVAVADLIAGLYAANGIQAALRERDRTGRGQHIDLSLLDCQLAALANVASNALVSGHDAPRHGNAHPNIVPYELFDAADAPLILAVGNDAQWRRCAAAIGRPEWAADPRFATNPTRVANRDVLRKLLRPVLAARTADHWLHLFRAADVPAGPVQSVLQALHDPQIVARGMILDVPHPEAGSVRLVANPLLREETPDRLPPALGEGGRVVVDRWLKASEGGL